MSTLAAKARRFFGFYDAPTRSVDLSCEHIYCYGPTVRQHVDAVEPAPHGTALTGKPLTSGKLVTTCGDVRTVKTGGLAKTGTDYLMVDEKGQIVGNAVAIDVVSIDGGGTVYAASAAPRSIDDMIKATFWNSARKGFVDGFTAPVQLNEADKKYQLKSRGLSGDWKAVGGDIKVAMKRHRERQRAS